MEIPVIFADTPSTVDTLQVRKKIAEGNFGIFQVYSSKHNATYALKVFPKTEHGTEQYKKEKLLSDLKHKNVIQYTPTVNDHPNQKFYTFLIEYAKFGTFLDIVKDDLLNHEVLIRSYFHQLIEGLEYIHSQGVAHLDLKLENLMMGSDFLLKIIDFDQAQLITDRQVTSGGTTGFRAPELRNRSGVDLAAIDVYSVGVILYTFVARELPFLEIDDAECKDPRSYSFFLKQNKKFWSIRAQRFGNKGLFSEEFIELVNGMLRSNPEERIKIQDVKNSKWYKGFVLDAESLKIAMQTRFEQFIKKN